MAQDSTTPPQARRSALYGFAEYVWNTERSRWLLRPRMKPIASALFALFVAGYLALASAQYVRNRWYRGCEETSFREMLLFVFPDPIWGTSIEWAPGFIKSRVDEARDAHRRKLAAVLFARAKSALERQDWRNFYNNIFHASQLDPSNLEARLLSSQVFFALRRDDDALDALEEALPGLLDRPDYVREYLRACFAKEQEARIVGVTKHILSQTELNPQVRELLATALATAHFHRGEFDDCLAVIANEKLQRSREALLLNLRVLWETGRRAQAIAALEPFAMAATNDPGLLSTLVEMKKDNGDIEGARSSAALFLIRASDKFQARVKFIDLLDASRENERRDEAVAAYRRDFANNDAALLLLCEFAADKGMVALCDDLTKEARARKSKEAPRFELLHIESHLSAGRYQDTVTQVDALFLKNPEWLPTFRRVFDCLRMVAQMSMNREDMAEIGFRRLSDSAEPLPMPLMTNVAKKLVQVGRADDALRVIDLAFERNARSVTALGGVIDVHLTAGGAPGTPALLRRLITFRRPNSDMLAKSRALLAGDAYLYEGARDALIADLETLAAGKPVVPPAEPRPPKVKLGAK